MNIVIVLIVCYLFFKLLDKAFEVYSQNKTEKNNREWLKYGFLSKHDLHHLDPFEFEKWCAEFLEKLGYTDVVVTSERIDGGKDIICKYNGEIVYVECKRYLDDPETPFQVSRDIVQKLVGAMVGDGIHHGIIITTGIITDRSIEYVKNLPEEYKVDLIDGDTLIKLYRETRLKEIDMNLKIQGA